MTGCWVCVTRVPFTRPKRRCLCEKTRCSSTVSESLVSFLIIFVTNTKVLMTFQKNSLARTLPYLPPNRTSRRSLLNRRPQLNQRLLLPSNNNLFPATT